MKIYNKLGIGILSILGARGLIYLDSLFWIYAKEAFLNRVYFGYTLAVFSLLIYEIIKYYLEGYTK